MLSQQKTCFLLETTWNTHFSRLKPPEILTFSAWNHLKYSLFLLETTWNTHFFWLKPPEIPNFSAWNHLQYPLPGPPVYNKQLLQSLCERSCKNVCSPVSRWFWHTAQNSQQAHKNSGGGDVSPGIKTHTISLCWERNLFLLHCFPLVQDFTTAYDFVGPVAQSV